MFKSNNETLKIGDIVVNKSDLKSMNGMFETGTRLIITGVGERGYDVADEFGNSMCECGWCAFEKLPRLEQPKHGDYIHTVVDTTDGRFEYISIFDKIDEDGKLCEIASCVYEAPEQFNDTLDNLFYNTKGEVPSEIRVAGKSEIRYLNALMKDDGNTFADGKLSKVNEK